MASSSVLCPTGFAQREPPGRDGKICTTETIERDKIRPLKPSSMAGFVQRDPSNMAGFVQQDPSSVARFVLWNPSCMARVARHA